MSPKDWEEKYSHLSFTAAMEQSAVDDLKQRGREQDVFKCVCGYETVVKDRHFMHSYYCPVEINKNNLNQTP